MNYRLRWDIYLTQEELEELVGLEREVSRLWKLSNEAEERYISRLREIAAPHIRRKLEPLGVTEMPEFPKVDMHVWSLRPKINVEVTNDSPDSGAVLD